MIEQLTICAYYDPSDILDDEGRFVAPLEELKKKGLTLAIESIETRINAKGIKYTVVKLVDREKSRQQLGKYLQMFKDIIEHTGKDGAPLPGINISLPDGSYENK